MVRLVPEEKAKTNKYEIESHQRSQPMNQRAMWACSLGHFNKHLACHL